LQNNRGTGHNRPTPKGAHPMTEWTEIEAFQKEFRAFVAERDWD
jgi:hypothetical protein